jgi:hypothetical protein
VAEVKKWQTTEGKSAKIIIATSKSPGRGIIHYRVSNDLINLAATTFAAFSKTYAASLDSA